MPAARDVAIGRAWRRRLPGRVRSLSALRSPREALLLVRVAAFAATVPWLMRLPLPRLAALLDRAPPPSRRRGRADAAAELERLDRLVALAPRVARPLVRTGCLTRGVTLYRFLRRAGLGVELRFGLDPRAGAADGHCWLALDGEPLLEREDPRPRFVEVWRLPPAAAS